MVITFVLLCLSIAAAAQNNFEACTVYFILALVIAVIGTSIRHTSTTHRYFFILALIGLGTVGCDSSPTYIQTADDYVDYLSTTSAPIVVVQELKSDRNPNVRYFMVVDGRNKYQLIRKELMMRQVGDTLKYAHYHVPKRAGL